ncbi:MAG: glycosyltransferase family 4 protein [Planctomycetota bacterium]
MTRASTLEAPKPATATGDNAAAPAATSLRIAYLTTEYPKASHTFIRRELMALEAQGHTITRLAIRDSGGAMADPLDQQEYEKTFHCLRSSVVALVIGAMLMALRHPVRWTRTKRVMWSMHRKSPRGLLRHIAYLIEAAAMLREVRRHDVQHVHVHFGTNAAAVARLMRHLGGPPFSMMIHGPGEYDDPRGFDLRGKVEDAAFVTAISDYCSAQLRRWIRIEDWSKIHIVRCPVADHFHEHAQPIDPAATSLVCVGRLTAQKGQLLLLDAVADLHNAGIPIRLVLAGDGEMRGDVEQRVRELGIESQVEITGWIDEATVRQHLIASRGLVLPSFAEGLPVVIMEALALRRPVISTHIAAIPELVRNGETGWLIPPANVEVLSHAMRELMAADVEALNAMGERGQELVRARHDVTAEAARLGALIASSLQAAQMDSGG